MELPLKKIPASSQDPKYLIIYGSPKVGKTTLVSELPDCIILDFEKGSDYISALKIQLNTIEDIIQFCKAVKEAGNPYKFAAVDTLTSLEDIVTPLALKRYIKENPNPDGTNYEGDLLNAPWGKGYQYLKSAMLDVLGMINKVIPNIILITHVKDKALKSIDGKEESTVKDMNMIGSLSSKLSAESDGIGFIYRDIESNLVIDFSNGGNVVAGARPAHLANKKIIVCEPQEDGTFKSYWDRIYPSLKTN